MFALLAAALAASTPSPAPATPAPATPATEAAVLESSIPWYERITVTVDDKGKQQSCRYEASYSSKGAEACGKAIADSMQTGVKGRSGTYSKVTFERRFSPGGRLDSGRLQPGDTLIGRQVMYLTFGADGLVQSCKVIARSGEAGPDYDCEEAKKEQFRTQADARPDSRQAFMTILAYGHEEHIA